MTDIRQHTVYIHEQSRNNNKSDREQSGRGAAAVKHFGSRAEQSRVCPELTEPTLNYNSWEPYTRVQGHRVAPAYRVNEQHKQCRLGLHLDKYNYSWVCALLRIMYVRRFFTLHTQETLKQAFYLYLRDLYLSPNNNAPECVFVRFNRETNNVCNDFVKTCLRCSVHDWQGQLKYFIRFKIVSAQCWTWLCSLITGKRITVALISTKLYFFVL